MDFVSRNDAVGCSQIELDFVSRNDAGWRSQKIGMNYLWVLIFLHDDVTNMTSYHVWIPYPMNFQLSMTSCVFAQVWRHNSTKTKFWILFPEMTLGDIPKMKRIRVKYSICFEFVRDYISLVCIVFAWGWHDLLRSVTDKAHLGTTANTKIVCIASSIWG